MKRISTLLFCWLFLASGAHAQWCTPTATSTTMNSYAPSSPVITNVTFNTINRSSTFSNKELYIYTMEGTSVSQGSSVPFSLTFVRDVPVCPTHHIRVWVDWNNDTDFQDPGELAFSENSTSAATSNGVILIPSNAALGTTRMRVAMKMTEPCGHTAPDPCVPNEPVGWHGEIEDYDLTITTASGIDELQPLTNINLIVKSNSVELNYKLSNNAEVQYGIYNATGQLVDKSYSDNQSAGKQSIELTKDLFDHAGVYIVRLVVDNHYYSKKFLISD